MKVSFEFDITPREVRQVLGLPDVEQLQADVIAAIRERMATGVDGFDPLSLMRSLFAAAQGFPGFDTVQKLVRRAAERGGGEKAP